MILFHLPGYEQLAAGLCDAWGSRAGAWTPARFANGEHYLRIDTTIAAADCVVLGSIAPPDQQLIEYTLLCHTAKKEGARTVTALLPYLAYARQEKPEPGKSQTTRWLGEVLRISGVDRLVTVDVHSRRAADAMPFPVRARSSAPLFAAVIRRMGWEEATLVAPDRGAIGRCEAVRAAMGRPMPIVHCEKQRLPDGVTSVLHAAAGARAVVVDDILDTGGTLIACCRQLRQRGTDDILVMVTHGLFTGDAWQELPALGVREIVCTNTTPIPAHARLPLVHRVSALPVLVEDRDGLGAQFEYIKEE